MENSPNWNKNKSNLPIHFTENDILNHKRDRNKKGLLLGYRIFKADKIIKIYGRSQHNAKYIKAKVKATMKKTVQYDVTLEFTNNNINKCLCTCPAGLSECCKHVFSLLWCVLDLLRQEAKELPQDASCTSKPQQWGVPKSTSNAAVQFKNLNFIKYTYSKKSKSENAKAEPSKQRLTMNTVPVLSNSIQTFYEDNVRESTLPMFCEVLNENSWRPTFWHWTRTEERRSKLIVNEEYTIIKSLVEQVEFKLTHVPAEDITVIPPLPCKNIGTETLLGGFKLDTTIIRTLNLDNISSLEQDTRTQSTCDTWKKEREKRYTASNFGRISKRRKALNLAFRNSLRQHDLQGIKHIREGLEAEKQLKVVYRCYHRDVLHKKIAIIDRGLIVHPLALHLGASPDGHVVDKDTKQSWLLEIKCVTKYENFMEACADRQFCVVNEGEELVINEKHNYFYQCQGQMLLKGNSIPSCIHAFIGFHFLGLSCCDILIYLVNSKEIFIKRLHLDLPFCEKMFKTLSLSYVEYAHQYLIRDI